MKTGDTYRVADVLLTAPWGQQFAVEVQLATLTDIAYRERTLDYLQASVTPVWLHLRSSEPLDPGYAVPGGTLRSFIENVDEEWLLKSYVPEDEFDERSPLMVEQQAAVGELIPFLAGHTTFGRRGRVRNSYEARALPAGRRRIPRRPTVDPRHQPRRRTVQPPTETMFQLEPERAPSRVDDRYAPFQHIDIAAWRKNPTRDLITERHCACRCGRPIVAAVPDWYVLPRRSEATHVLVNPHLAGGTIIGPCRAG